MEKERYTKDSEIFEKIKDVIYELHPIKKPRIDSWECLINRTKKPEIEISFYFYKDDDSSIKTQVIFLDGNESVKNGISTVYVVDSEISKQTIGKLISFILSEFPYIKSLHENSNGFEINFGIGVENEEQEGISLSAIDISFDTHPLLYNEFKEIFHDYLKYIVVSFYDVVSRTPQFKNEYIKYCDKIKRQTIESLSYDELQEFARIIDEKRLRELLLKMDNDYFFELCDCFQRSSKTAKKKVLGLKGCIITDVTDTE